MFGPFSRSSSVTINCIKYITECIKIALSELRSVLQCLYHAALQVWFYSTVVKIVKCGIADGKVGDSVRCFLVVWDFKAVVPGGRRCFRTQVALNCQTVAGTFTDRELPVSVGLNMLH